MSTDRNETRPTVLQLRPDMQAELPQAEQYYQNICSDKTALQNHFNPHFTSPEKTLFMYYSWVLQSKHDYTYQQDLQRFLRELDPETSKNISKKIRAQLISIIKNYALLFYKRHNATSAFITALENNQPHDKKASGLTTVTKMLYGLLDAENIPALSRSIKALFIDIKKEDMLQIEKDKNRFGFKAIPTSEKPSAALKELTKRAVNQEYLTGRMELMLSLALTTLTGGKEFMMSSREMYSDTNQNDYTVEYLSNNQVKITETIQGKIFNAVELTSDDTAFHTYTGGTTYTFTIKEGSLPESAHVEVELGKPEFDIELGYFPIRMLKHLDNLQTTGNPLSALEQQVSTQLETQLEAYRAAKQAVDAALIGNYTNLLNLMDDQSTHEIAFQTLYSRNKKDLRTIVEDSVALVSKLTKDEALRIIFGRNIITDSLLDVGCPPTHRGSVQASVDAFRTSSQHPANLYTQDELKSILIHHPDQWRRNFEKKGFKILRWLLGKKLTRMLFNTRRYDLEGDTLAELVFHSNAAARQNAIHAIKDDKALTKLLFSSKKFINADGTQLETFYTYLSTPECNKDPFLARFNKSDVGNRFYNNHVKDLFSNNQQERKKALNTVKNNGALTQRVLQSSTFNNASGEALYNLLLLAVKELESDDPFINEFLHSSASEKIIKYAKGKIDEDAEILQSVVDSPLGCRALFALTDQDIAKLPKKIANRSVPKQTQQPEVHQNKPPSRNYDAPQGWSQMSCAFYAQGDVQDESLAPLARSHSLTTALTA